MPSTPAGDFSHAPDEHGRIASLPDDAVWPDAVAPGSRRVIDRPCRGAEAGQDPAGLGIEVAIPSKWASDPARVYPVYIDPQWAFNSGPAGGTDESVGDGCGNCYYDGQPNTGAEQRGGVEGNAYVDRIG
ncbi:MAG: hypothetical protein QOK43_1713 [Acidimicrobiaceae bacterium]|nr:hypothetical protein [Acidimicrobiaceae bacterium]